jgi:hypothetical protein
MSCHSPNIVSPRFSGSSGYLKQTKVKAGLVFSCLSCLILCTPFFSPSKSLIFFLSLFLNLYQPPSYRVVTRTVYTNTLVQRFHCLVIILMLCNWLDLIKKVCEFCSTCSYLNTQVVVGFFFLIMELDPKCPEVTEDSWTKRTHPIPCLCSIYIHAGVANRIH